MTQPPPIPPATRPKMSRSRCIAIMISAVMMCMALAILVLFIVCPLAGHPMLKKYSMPSHGMDPTISAGDGIVAEAFSFWTSPPARGEVVVFRVAGIDGIERAHGASPDTVFVQRIAALAGDTLEFQPGKILVNGVEFVTQSEGREIHYDGGMGLQYVNPKITVPQGHVFTLGDNTQRSSDGRYWGFVPEENILLRARWRISPSERRGSIH